MEILKIENLNFTYPERDFQTLTNINISVNDGEFICLIGKSGCGKSTLLRQLKKELTPSGKTSGEIHILGEERESLDALKSASSIGFVMQNPDAQTVCDKVWHELAFGLESSGLSSNEIRGRVSEIANFFGINSWFDSDTASLSGGQKQLLNLASVMVMNPQILILDEPTSQLDPIASHEFLNIVHRINRELGITVILSEQRLEEALTLCDRVWLMDSGKIIADTEPRWLHNIMRDKNSPMLIAMPVAVRAFASTGSTAPSPLTVRDGREWLRENYSEFKKLIPPKAETNGETILSARGLWFRYEKNSPDVLKNFNIILKKGELYALVGGNGSGKTTAVSCIGGQLKPYRGKIKTADGLKLCTLPQNPDVLFAEKTVADEIADSMGKLNSDKSADEALINDIIDFCELGFLLNFHPFDLSGGEKQRLALAKLLIAKPDILLMDEPTKGLDGEFKQKLARNLKELQKTGLSIIIISHDIEFCAEYADRVGMLFDGEIVSEADSREFFSNKSFYTSSASRMARGIIPDAVLTGDIIYSIDGKEKKPDFKGLSMINSDTKPLTKDNPSAKRRLNRFSIIAGIIFAICFGAVQFGLIKDNYTMQDYALQISAVVLLSLSVYCLIPTKNCPRKKSLPDSQKGKNKRALISALILLLAAPLTIYTGMVQLGDRKYNFISMMLILETFIPFIFSANEKKTRTRELVTIAVLCSIAVSGRLAFAMLPQFKPTCAIVIISGIAMGAESGFLVGCVSAFVSNIYFGQGPWTPWQMFCFGLIGFISGIIASKGILKCGRVSLSIYGFLSAVVLYGGIMNPASVIMWQPNPSWEMISLSYIQGLPIDLIHGSATAFFLYFVSEPMLEKLERIRLK